MTRDLIRADLIREEGDVPYAYKDHLGYWTIGVGFLIDKDKGGRLPDAVRDFWLDHVLDEIEAGLDRNISWWRTLPEGAQRALMEMAYQLGIGGLLEFKNMLAALQKGDPDTAIKEALDSKWAKQDTPERAKRVTGLFRRAG